jgi:hypothetical protein
MFRPKIFFPVILSLTLGMIVFLLFSKEKFFSYYGFLSAGNLSNPFLLIAFAIVLTCGLWILGRTRWNTPIRNGLKPLWPKIPFMALIFFQFALAIWFMQWVNQGILVGDDHGDTLYGLHLLEKTFPRLVSYNPFWNAGALEWEPVRHGTLNLFYIIRPLRLFFSLPETYNLIIPLVFIFGLPWLFYYSLGLMHFSPWARLLGVVMAILPHLQHAYWIKVGCMPSVLSSALLPVVVLMAVRVFLMEEPRWRHLILLVVFLSLALMWMPFGFMLALPAVILFLLFQKTFRRKRLLFLILALLGLALVNFHWMFSFLRHYHIQDFTARSFFSEGKLTAEIFYIPLLVFIQHIRPLIIIPGIIGFFYIKPPLRSIVLICVFNLIFILTLMDFLFKGYELFRMDVPLSFLLIIPAVCAFDRLIPKGFPGKLVVGLLVALLLLQGWGTFQFYGQKLEERRIHKADPRVLALANWLKGHTNKEGRILIAGPIVHDFGGHVAFMQFLSARPLVADFYYDKANPLDITLVKPLQSDPLPEPEAFQKALSLYNISTIVGLHTPEHEKWEHFLDSQTYLYPIKDLDAFRIYATNIAPSYFLKGSGRMESHFNKLVVTPYQTGPMILKFHYFPGLKAPEGVRIKPFSISPEVNFIELDIPDLRPITLTFR